MLSNLTSKKIFLASKSPRRHELLKGLGIEFEVLLAEVEETYPSDLKAEKIPEFLAEKKASAVLSELKENDIIITADTIVILDGKVLEKPLSFEHAQQMLHSLSGKEHLVVTGVSIQSLSQKVTFSDHTLVKFAPLSSDEIDYYINNYQPFDKAGSYGAQDWIGLTGIEKLTGSYFNVMGLPVHKVYQHLKEF